MSDEKIQVEFGADTGNLQQGSETAAASVQGFSEQAKAAFASVAEATQASMSEMSMSLKEGMVQARESMEGIAGAIKGVQSAFLLFGEVMMAGFIGERILEMGKSTAELADTLERTSRMTGMTTDALQELKFAAEMNDVSFETMNRGLKKLSLAMTLAQQGSAQAVAAFQEVGISADQLSQMSLEEVLKRVADRYHDSADGATKMANAQQLFGRGGMELIPLLDKGSSALAEYGKQARDVGAVMSEDDIQAAAELNEQFKLFHQTMAAAERTVSAALIPSLTALVGAFNESMKAGGAMRAIVDVLSGAFKVVADTVYDFVQGIRNIGTVIGAVSAAVAAAAHGNFSEARNIIKSLGDDLEKSGEKMLDFRNKLYGMEGQKPKPEAEEDHRKKPELKPVSTNGQASDMDLWKEELEQKKEAEGNYFKSSLSMEEEFWQAKLAKTKNGSKERRAVEHELYQVHRQEAAQSLADDIADLKFQQEAFAKNGEEKLAIQGEIVNRMAETFGTESREYSAAVREMVKISQELEKERIKSAEEVINKERDLNIESLNMELDKLKFQKDMGEISAVEELQRTKEIEEQKYQIELQAAETRANLLPEGPEKQKALDAIETAQAKHNQKMGQLSNAMTLAMKGDWDKLFSGITSAFETSIQGMIMGTTTLQRVMRNMAQSIVAEFVNLGVKKAASWAASELAMTGATAQGVASRGLIEGAGAVQSLAVSALASLKKILNYAYESAAGAFNAVVEIPIVGPALAPVAAAGAFATVSGFGASIASAAGGWEVPADQLAQVHKNEMILPPSLSDKIRNMTEPGAGHTFHNNFHIHAVDADSVKNLFKSHGRVIAETLSKQIRDFQKI